MFHTFLVDQITRKGKLFGCKVELPAGMKLTTVAGKIGATLQELTNFDYSDEVTTYSETVRTTLVKENAKFFPPWFESLSIVDRTDEDNTATKAKSSSGKRAADDNAGLAPAPKKQRRAEE
ncbi:hypothetical protein QQZ08_004729 [Neonectria magnoliae]|uniref:Uncharacterized protein n=1 Tax=Neonectria magnoliae TaxID=2732573 RepID=A0ABR1I6G7_9HYPO